MAGAFVKTLLNGRKWLAALSVFLLAAVLFARAYHWHFDRWVIVLATLAAATCLALAINQRSLIWHRLGILTLFLSMVRCWREGNRFWAIIAAGAVIFGLVQVFRRFQSSAQFEGAQQWPLTRGQWAHRYVRDDSRVIDYWYQANGGYYSGSFAAGSPFTRGLGARLDDLKGKPMMVRYKPEKPEISVVFRSDQVNLSV
jgi:hypothetical protein